MFFGTVTKTMMTAMNKSPDFKSDSDDSDPPSPPHFEPTCKNSTKFNKFQWY